MPSSPTLCGYLVYVDLIDTSISRHCNGTYGGEFTEKACILTQLSGTGIARILVWGGACVSGAHVSSCRRQLGVTALQQSAESWLEPPERKKYIGEITFWRVFVNVVSLKYIGIIIIHKCR